MRVLRGTLTFVLGMIIGIILFVIAIGGAVMVIGTSITVGELQGNFTEEDIISPDSNLYQQTILEAIQSVISDVQALDSLTMRTLYEHYGIELLNGISGIDFTSKEFYDTDLKSLMNDLSIVVNSFTLDDISGLAGVDFREYNLPVLTDNLGNNIETALDNILSSLNGDLSIRDINTNFGIDVGVEDNALIKTLQDVSLSTFGEVINAITLNTLLDVDSDLFVQKGENPIYQSADMYEEVSKSDLQNAGFTPAKGVETYYAGASQNADGTWTMIEKELRFVKKTLEDDSVKYVVDNSCYKEGFDANSTDKTFYRHVQYTRADGSEKDPAKLFVETYYNRIATVNGNVVTLKSAGFTALNALNNVDLLSLEGKINANGTITFEQDEKDLYFVLDKDISKDSLIRKYNEEEDKDDENVVKREQSFVCVNKGESEAILQIVAPMTVSELQNADDLLGSLTVGNVVDTTDPETALVLVSLKDCKLTEIGTKVNDLPIDQLVEIKDEDSQIMKALQAHGCTLGNIGSMIDDFAIGEIMTITFDTYVKSATGDYVKDYIYVPYNKYVHAEGTLVHNAGLVEDGFYTTTDGGATFTKSGETNVDNIEDPYVLVVKYRLFNEKTDTGKQRYALDEGTGTESTAIALQSMAKRGYTLDDIGTSINDMGFDELVRIKSDSSLIMKSLAKHGATLDNIGDTVDALLIDEVIEINDDSATIMKSLQARGCTITELGTVANTLTLKEVTKITFDNYVDDNDNGKYVLLGNEDDGYYYTLYNPAVHTPAVYKGARYTREEVAGSSSKVLQRLANSTVDGLSTAFDSLTLGDVLDIDIDILAQDASTEADKFYYDDANSLYMRQAGADLTDVISEYQNFHVATEGESSSVLKRLAYVEINDLSTAMEKVMKDMMLRELVDIYDASAVEVIEQITYISVGSVSNAISPNDMFIVKPVGEDGKGKYTFVYNPDGQYIKRDYAYIKLTDEDLGEVTSTTVKYNYEKLTQTTYASVGTNIYCHTTDEAGKDKYLYNIPLSAALIAQATTAPSKLDKLYTRVQNDAGAETAKIYTVPADESWFVLLNGVYVQYDAANPVHWGLDIYRLTTPTEDCPVFYVPITTPSTPLDTGYKYVEGENIYSKVYCEDIYVVDEDGTYVFIGGEYVTYDSTVHTDEDIIKYKKVTGYLASASECFTSPDGGETFNTDKGLYNIDCKVKDERQKSEKVLAYLSNVTIDGINDAVKNATIGDLMDITPGSLFEDFSDSTLDQVSGNLQSKLKTWSIGELAEKANITSLDPTVKAALYDVSLDNFFKSLEYQGGVGIIVNLEKAYNLT